MQQILDVVYLERSFPKGSYAIPLTSVERANEVVKIGV